LNLFQNALFRQEIPETDSAMFVLMHGFADKCVAEREAPLARHLCRTKPKNILKSSTKRSRLRRWAADDHMLG
jgi:hypothetical protein